MGIDFNAIAGIGLKVDRDQLYQTKKIRLGDHDFGEDVLYHPQTGKPLWMDDEVPIEGFDEDDFPSKIDGYDVFQGVIEDVFFIFVASVQTASHRSGRDDAGCKKTSIPSSKEILLFIEKMKARDLFTPTRFGLWAISEVG